jgi:high-affinity nickel permease
MNTAKPTFFSLLFSLVGLCMFLLFTVAFLEIFHEGDNTSTITALIGIVAPISGMLIALILKENHVLLNSQLTQLLEATRQTAYHDGQQQERREVRDRQTKFLDKAINE